MENKSYLRKPPIKALARFIAQQPAEYKTVFEFLTTLGLEVIEESGKLILLYSLKSLLMTSTRDILQKKQLMSNQNIHRLLSATNGLFIWCYSGSLPMVIFGGVIPWLISECHPRHTQLKAAVANAIKWSDHTVPTYCALRPGITVTGVQMAVINPMLIRFARHSGHTYGAMIGCFTPSFYNDAWYKISSSPENLLDKKPQAEGGLNNENLEGEIIIGERFQLEEVMTHEHDPSPLGYFDLLPLEVVLEVCCYLSLTDFLRLEQTSSSMRRCTQKLSDDKSLKESHKNQFYLMINDLVGHIILFSRNCLYQDLQYIYHRAGNPLQQLHAEYDFFHIIREFRQINPVKEGRWMMIWLLVVLPVVFGVEFMDTAADWSGIMQSIDQGVSGHFGLFCLLYFSLLGIKLSRETLGYHMLSLTSLDYNGRSDLESLRQNSIFKLDQSVRERHKKTLMQLSQDANKLVQAETFYQRRIANSSAPLFDYNIKRYTKLLARFSALSSVQEMAQQEEAQAKKIN